MATKKTVGTSQVLTFLGVELDTKNRPDYQRTDYINVYLK
jgi:hypothetical protein